MTEFLIFNYNSNQYGYLNKMGGYKALTPQDIPGFLNSILTSVQTDTRVMWIYGIDLIVEDILRVIFDAGYHDVTEEQKPIKKFNVGDFDYTIADSGIVYRMRIRCKGKKTLTIYNPVNILGKNMESTVKDFCPIKVEDFTQRLTYAVMNGIAYAVGKQTKRVPFTISMIAQRQWKKLTGIDFDTSDYLIDCNKFGFPDFDGTLEQWLRKTYRGGWNYLSDLGNGHDLGEGIILDVNSLYPAMMLQSLPWGTPEFFKGDVPEDIKKDKYYYYFIHFTCNFKLKKGYFPYIGINDWLHGFGKLLTNSKLYRRGGQEITEIVDEDGVINPVNAELYLSMDDFETFMEAYDVWDLEFIDGCYFRTSKYIFKDYVEIYYDQKTEARANGNRAEERFAKMMLNSLTGALAKYEERHSVTFEYKDGFVRETELGIITHSQSKSHIHIASALLSKARSYIYHMAVANRTRFMYSDTDSLHLTGKTIPDGIIIDDKIGHFKIEHTFTQAVYFKPKVYAIRENGKYKLTCAGLSKEYREYNEDVLNSTSWLHRIVHDKFGDPIKKIPGWEESVEYSDIYREDPYMVYSDMAKQIRKYEQDLCSVKDNQKIKEFRKMLIPNGFRTASNFKSTTHTYFMDLRELDTRAI